MGGNISKAGYFKFITFTCLIFFCDASNGKFYRGNEMKRQGNEIFSVVGWGEMTMICFI